MAVAVALTLTVTIPEGGSREGGSTCTTKKATKSAEDGGSPQALFELLLQCNKMLQETTQYYLEPYPTLILPLTLAL